MVIRTMIIYYTIINLLAFVMYGADKLKAKIHTRRTPEKTLLGVAFAGGALGAFLGMQIFRHKTRHDLFKVLVPISLGVHILIVLLVLVLVYR